MGQNEQYLLAVGLGSYSLYEVALNILFFYYLAEVCCLDYSCSLLRVTQPLEDRMEQAFFSPPLSKQRVEFAVKYIKESHASTLVYTNFSPSDLVYR